MSSKSFRIITLVLVAGIMTTCLGLFFTSTKRIASESGLRKHSQKRLRHTFEATKNDIPSHDFRLVIHGGAGVVSKDIDGKPFYDSLRRIMVEAYSYAKKGSKDSGRSVITALDVVEFTVRLLENDPLFNAGRGAVFTADGTHEMEASIMNGSNLKCGAVSLIKTVKNPITLARTVMEKTKHNYLIGESAEKLAVQESLEIVDRSYFSTEKRWDQLLLAKKSGSVVNDHDLESRKSPQGSNFATVVHDSVAVDVDTLHADNNPADLQGDIEGKFPGSTGTVGCVCMYGGHVAAATSTGGLTNKMAGRIGDTPIIGAGTYANDETCAVSATGKGEEFMRHVAAYDVAARIEIGQMSLNEAVTETVFKKLPVGSGGIIAVNIRGEYSMEFNSKGMFRGVCDSSGDCSIGIWEEMIPIKMDVDIFTAPSDGAAEDAATDTVTGTALTGGEANVVDSSSPHAQKPPVQ